MTSVEVSAAAGGNVLVDAPFDEKAIMASSSASTSSSSGVSDSENVNPVLSSGSAKSSSLTIKKVLSTDNSLLEAPTASTPVAPLSPKEGQPQEQPKEPVEEKEGNELLKTEANKSTEEDFHPAVADENSIEHPVEEGEEEKPIVQEEVAVTEETPVEKEEPTKEQSKRFAPIPFVAVRSFQFKPRSNSKPYPLCRSMSLDGEKAKKLVAAQEKEEQPKTASPTPLSKGVPLLRRLSFRNRKEMKVQQEGDAADVKTVPNKKFPLPKATPPKPPRAPVSNPVAPQAKPDEPIMKKYVYTLHRNDEVSLSIRNKI